MDNERSIVILFAYIRHETTTHESQENEDTTTTCVYMYPITQYMYFTAYCT